MESEWKKVEKIELDNLFDEILEFLEDLGYLPTDLI